MYTLSDGRFSSATFKATRVKLMAGSGLDMNLGSATVEYSDFTFKIINSHFHC